MVIKDIKVKIINIPLKKPFITSLRRVDVLESIILTLKTRSNLVGYGETAPTFAVTGDDTETIINALQLIYQNIKGKSVTNFTEIIDTVHNSIEANYSAKSAMEIALYDIFVQNLKLPLYKFLGGKKKKFKTGITISLNDTHIMIRDSVEAINRGFDSLKIKLGEDYKEEIYKVKSIYKAVGKDISLKLDANQGWSEDECIRFLNSLEKDKIPIELIEQPIEKGNIEGLKYIKERTSIPILADESVFSPKDAIEILEKQAVDFINIKLDKCGGISKALLIADICKLYGVKCMIGCMLEGSISVSAAVHVASSRNDTITMIDLDAPVLYENYPIQVGVRFNESNIEITDTCGLGIRA